MIDVARTGPRVAVQIDRADLPDFQRAARLLLAHPLVSPTSPKPDSLLLVRRLGSAAAGRVGRVLQLTGSTSARTAPASSARRPPCCPTGARRRAPAARWAGWRARSCASRSLPSSRLASRPPHPRSPTRSSGSAPATTPADRSHQPRPASGRSSTGRSRLEDRGCLSLRRHRRRWPIDADGGGDALYDVDRDIAVPASGRLAERPARRPGPRRLLVEVRGSSTTPSARGCASASPAA